jgi:hypothetical protein
VTGYCAACDRQVLTWMDLEDSGQECRRCLTCDGVVSEALRPAGLSALDAQGFEVRDPHAQQTGCRCAAGGCDRRSASD